MLNIISTTLSYETEQPYPSFLGQLRPVLFYAIFKFLFNFHLTLLVKYNSLLSSSKYIQWLYLCFCLTKRAYRRNCKTKFWLVLSCSYAVPVIHSNVFSLSSDDSVMRFYVVVAAVLVACAMTALAVEAELVLIWSSTDLTAITNLPKNFQSIKTLNIEIM